MRLLLWAVFFCAYGFAFLSFYRWLARRRVAALTDLSQFGTNLRIVAFLGSCSFAVAPPLVELGFRIWDGKGLENWGFAAFMGAWVISACPGVIVSRRMLRAGGIDPDKES